MIHSRITVAAEATIPEAVRIALGLRDGDDLVYEIEGDHVVLRRAEGADPFTANFATFTEWASEADRAYDALATRYPRNAS